MVAAKHMSNIPCVAIIMCVYKNDTVEHLKLAIESMLNQNSVTPFLYIFADGLLPESLNYLLSTYSDNDYVYIKFNDSNVGLATGLNWLIDNAVELDKFEYIARMDADDVSLPDRLIKQICKLRTVGASVIGTDCYEIDNAGNRIFHKKMQSADSNLKHDIIKRCPFIHPSVLFLTEVFKDGFRYDSSLMNTQDYYLWVELAYHGYCFSNVSEPLLLFRRNEGFYRRRGIKKAINEFKGRIFAMRKLNIFSVRNVFFTFVYLSLRLMPASVSSLAYKYFR